MIRRFLCVLVAAFAALSANDAAAKGGGAAAAAASSARAAFAKSVHAAEGILASATASFTSALAAGTKTPQEAALGYGAAFTYFTGTVKKAADTASASFATDVSAAIVAANGADVPGALAGSGGGLDAFSDAMQASLDATRRRALARARAFAARLAKGAVRTQMTVSLPPWTFERRAAPASPSAFAPADDTIRLLAVIAAKLDDGTVVVAASGRAPRSANGNFDVRLAAGTHVSAVGSLLSAGGMPVTIDGTWSATVKLNDPTQGQSEPAGNRAVEFGVDPFDGGLAGRQPGRYVQGGVIGVP
jgi:hypothetical protein